MTMMPSFLPGNLAMMLWMGKLPTGVVAVKLSTSTSSPARCDLMYCSALACPGLPGLREPIETNSFTYWKARVELTFGAGSVVAGGAASAETGASAAGAASFAFAVWVSDPGLEQAKEVSRQR